MNDKEKVEILCDHLQRLLNKLEGAYIDGRLDTRLFVEYTEGDMEGIKTNLLEIQGHV